METIEKDNFVFCVDIEKTKEYYLSNSLCVCPGCRNLYAQIKTLPWVLDEPFPCEENFIDKVKSFYKKKKI